MTTDIYTLAHISKRSEEHILLSSLGGRLSSFELIDRDTNSVFGNTIDAALSRAVQVFRILLNAESSRGNAAPPLHRLLGMDDQFYDLHVRGVPHIAAPRVEFRTEPDGTLTITGQVRSRDELSRLVERRVRDIGLEPGDIVSAATEASVRAPSLNIPLSFGADEHGCIAKMTCNLFASKHHGYFTQDAFDRVRQFVLNGGNSTGIVWISEDPLDLSAANPLGPLDHLVAVKSDDSGTIMGRVILFGYLQFSVLLGSATGMRAWASSYRCDQLSQTDRLDDSRDLEAIAGVGISSIPSAGPRQLRSFEGALRSLLQQVGEIEFNRRRDEIISESITDVFGSKHEGELITPDEINRLAAMVSDRFTQLLDRT